MENIKELGLLNALEKGPVICAEGYLFEMELKLPDNGQAFPVSLDPFLLSRYEMAEFAVKVRDMGIRYIGICCGAGPHHVRSMAEALGRTPAAGKYSPDMSLHPIFGETDVKADHVSCLLGAVEDIK